MQYITYLRTSPQPKKQDEQMSFNDFYTALFNNIPITAETYPEELPFKPKFRTITTEQLSTTFQNKTYNDVIKFLEKFQYQIRGYAAADMATRYSEFTIPKRTGGRRTINAPDPALKELLARINHYLSTKGIHPHNCAYAYVQHRSIKDALEVHQKRGYKWFMKLDLKNFFGSCNYGFIMTQLNKIPFFNILNNRDLEDLIHLMMLNDGLPQGSPLSPWITNQIMVPIDHAIAQLCHAHNLVYTRYADDMLFSGATKNAVRHASTIVTNALTDTPFRINAEKTKICSAYGQNWNLGLMLNKDNAITVGHKRKERCRATIHNFCEQPESYHYQESTELLGLLQYYITIEPDYFANLLTKYGTKYNIDIRAKLIDIIRNRS